MDAVVLSSNYHFRGATGCPPRPVRLPHCTARAVVAQVSQNHWCHGWLSEPRHLNPSEIWELATWNGTRKWGGSRGAQRLFRRHPFGTTKLRPHWEFSHDTLQMTSPRNPFHNEHIKRGPYRVGYEDTAYRFWTKFAKVRTREALLHETKFNNHSTRNGNTTVGQ